MKRSGIADLHLHPGHAPSWLTKRMKAMADALFQVMYDVHGPTESLRRLGDPLWFQALSNVLGFDWDSSGTTTVLCGVLHSVLNPERHGLSAAGGKGARSRKTPTELQDIANQLDLGEQLARRLCYASRMTAKVDSAALQDNYQLYHHMFFLAPDYGAWTVVQQGMDPETRTSRRYHWISERLTTFIEEPHSGLFSQKRPQSVMNLTSKNSRRCRDTCVALVIEERPAEVRRQFYAIKPHPSYQKTTLTSWFDSPQRILSKTQQVPHHRVFPERMDWQAVKRIYDLQPENFEELLAVKGVGPSTIRGLALLSEMVHGESPSWEDPVRMTFAFGGKDGVPYPVNRRAYDEAIFFLEETIDQAKLGQKEKLDAFRRLRKYLYNPITTQ